MDNVKPLPTYLAKRYAGWKATTHAQNAAWYRRLAEEGQRPRTMVISCCDSRVHVTSIFGAEQGEFFMHRNIANLVPPFNPDGDKHGTSAAIEYAVTALHVSEIIIVGHSNCGGVKGCADMCSGNAPELEAETSFVGRWVDTIRPGYERIEHLAGNDDFLTQLEMESVRNSLSNLMTFPFVREAVEAGELSLHGLWNDISDGTLKELDPETDEFVAV